jgi:hypothetical protein
MDLRAILKTLKIGQLVPPQLKDNGAFAGNTYIDTLGLSALLVLIEMGATDIAMGSTAITTPPLLEECDTTGGNYTAITGAALSAVIGAGDDNKLYGIHLNLAKSHKRYVRIQAPTAGDGTAGVNMSAIALGFPPDQMPKSAAEMGLAELIEA